MFIFLSLFSKKIFATISDEYFFEDFSYTSTVKTNDSIETGSIFGKNTWKTTNNDTLLKAWFRWNIDERDFSKNSKIVLTKDGFQLNFNPGKIDFACQPMIQSAFLPKYGIYASKIKYSRILNPDKITQAFWLISPISFIFKQENERLQYRDEIDFEFNNWWRGENSSQMSVGANNRNYREPNQKDLDCICKNNYRYEFFEKCNTKMTEFTDKWIICYFILDTLT
jgi:hypothetical protein